MKFRPETKALMDKYQAPGLSLKENLTMNLAFATAAARLQYFRVREPIPETLDGQAAYWKKYWNTKHGKGTTDQYSEHYKKYVL
ncbi:hypothetical protein [Pseudemcibacter aquimaris]|uniref:hypothetical protein n=1 Tax=Pseudemcibacter aquimaris TaxID=2857064 RepID=UPI0020114CF6|nr:hypothetical protein [Pseudemcibacter aquimaris]MCC3859871.1 hypothetical protein [Pseudemcibacter aquimaris]WDU57203.1 hypothetical protein KW060_08330 [Pseudemcibacter aquimaris]